MIVARRSRTTQFAAILGIAGILALAGCSGGSGGGSQSNEPGAKNLLSTTNGQYGSLPNASGTPTNGGTVTYSIINGSQPNFIFPVTPGADFTTYNSNFQTPMFVPLYNNEVSDRPRLSYADSIANKPIYSNGDKTVTIPLKTTYTWADGQKVDAQDVMFFIDLLQAAVKESAANFGPYTRGDFPDNVKSMTAPNRHTVVLHLTQAYNPEWFTETQVNVITPLPSTTWAKSSANGRQLDFSNPSNAKAIYDYLKSASSKPSTFDSDPLWQDVDGPYRLTSFTASTDANTMVANPKYTGPNPPHVQTLKAVFYASSTAEFNAIREGSLNVGTVDQSSLPQVPLIERGGYHVWGYPDLGFNYLVFNFKDTTHSWNKIVAQLYIRQVFARLQDQTSIIKGVYGGAAAPAYGPVPAIPATSFVPSNVETNPYPFSVAAASKLLTDHGWHVVPNGTATCESPGTAANQCGAGIPKGANMNITCYYTSDPMFIGQQVESVASNAKKVGINITPVSKTFNFIVQNYDDPISPQFNNDWAIEDYGGFTLGDYPTTDTIFNTGGSNNEGDYSDPKADRLINASKFSSNPNAVKTEASYLAQQLPAVFQPNPDEIFAWKGVSGPADSFAFLSQFGFQPNEWWVTKPSS